MQIANKDMIYTHFSEVLFFSLKFCLCVFRISDSYLSKTLHVGNKWLPHFSAQKF